MNKHLQIWFWRKKSLLGKSYCSRSLQVSFYPQHWKQFSIRSNGATRQQQCYDLHIWFLGIAINYTNWDYKK